MLEEEILARKAMSDNISSSTMNNKKQKNVKTEQKSDLT